MNNYNIKTDRNSITVFLAVTVSFILAIIVSICSLAMLARENTKELDTMLTYSIYDTITSNLNESIIVSRTMASDAFLADFLKNEDSYSEEEASNLLKNYLSTLKSNLGYDSAFVAAENSRKYYTVEGLYKTLDAEKDEHDIWYTHFLNKNLPYDLNVDSDEVNRGEWTVYINTRIEDSNGELLGVCGIGVQMTNLQSIFREAENEHHIKINLVDENGVVQVDTDDINIEKAKLDTSIFNLDEKDDDYTYHTTESGEFVVTKYVEYLDWYLVVSSAPTAISNRFISIIMVNVVLFLLVMGILIATLFSILKRSKKERDDKEKLLVLSERAIAASDAKSSFLSNMSHEIRTPLNAVLGMNEMIQRDCKDDDILAYSDSIKASGNTLLGLINDILDFSKIEAGKMEIVPVEYDLSKLINDLAVMIKDRAEKKGLELVFHFDSELPRFLYGDEIRIKQVITNILTNAVKYTEHGKVTFTIGYDKMHSNFDEVCLRIAVTDTGIGIKSEDIYRLFAEFERVDETRNRNIEGSGLGLNITQSLLHLMGSTLRVESEYEKGSTFYFDLVQTVTRWENLGDYKLAYKETVSEREQYTEMFTAENARILVVDDIEINLVVVKNFLKRTLIGVDTAESGDEALYLTKKFKYDIIFMDHMMPEKDGIETLKEIISDTENLNRETPVICLTANAISGAKEQYMKEGFCDYLSKPIDSAALEKMILKYLPKGMITRSAIKKEDISEEDEGILDTLELLRGSAVDINEGIKLNGSIKDYYELLGIFYKSLGDRRRELNEFYEDSNWKDYTIKVHALKSAAKTVGIKELAGNAQKLENAGKAEDIAYIRKEHSGLIDKCMTIEKLLSKVIVSESKNPDESEIDKPKIDEQLLVEMLGKVKEAAEEMDSDALFDLFEEMEQYSIPSDKASLFNELHKASDRFEYETIVRLLDVFSSK